MRIKDIFIVFAILLAIVVAFYAFQILVLLAVGYVIWLAIPLIRELNV